jgi:hypothetical protein
MEKTLMADLKRHIGKIRNTDRRCVVVYMQMPNLDTHALIIDTDALPDSFHEWVMDVVDSDTGQKSTNLADVLSRRPSPDSNADMLNALHARGYLQRQPIDNIIMLPRPNMPVPLRQIVDNMGTMANKTPVVEAQVPTEDKFNRIAQNLQVDASEQQMQIASTILREALDLEREANRKKAQAYKLVPQLDPDYMAPVPVAKAPVVKASVSESFLAEPPAVLPVVETDVEDPEMLEILRRAQEHLDRAAFREDHPEVLESMAEEPKRGRGRPKKSETVA